MMTTTNSRTGSLSKTARLMILQKMQEAGTLDGMSKPALAELLSTTRFTIYRDLADLKDLQPLYKSLLEKVEQS
jgi:transcriptional antiterminator